MHVLRPTRTCSRYWKIPFIALGLCVFLWGLQYKLSLYDPPDTSSPHVPMAKLLSKNEQTSQSKRTAPDKFQPLEKTLQERLQAAFLILLIAELFRFAGMLRYKPAQSSSLYLRASFLEPLFDRPPPMLV